MNINFYVINLDRSTERLELISSQLSNQKINVKRIPAIDGIELNIDKEADDSMCKSEMGRSIQPGEVGCFLSHIKALETFISSKSDIAAIDAADLNSPSILLTDADKDLLEIASL